MIKTFNVLKATAFVTYKEWAAYRSHMLVSVFVGPIYFLVQYFIWSAVLKHQETINGFTLEQILMYYGITMLVNYCIMDFAGWNLQMLIHTGKFLTFMLRPVNHKYFAFSQKIGHRLLGFCLEFIPVYLLFCFVFRLNLVPDNFIWTLISVILGFVMMFLVNYTIGITSFWLIRTGGISRMFLLIRDIFAGVFIPLSFFPETMQKILFYLPFQYISYVPVRVFLGSYELAGKSYEISYIVFLQFVAVIVMLLISEVLWKLGIKKFSGVGA